MIFLGYIEGDEMDLTIKATAGNIIEYYFSLAELQYECGEDAEYSIIYLEDVEIILDDLSIMRFDDIGIN